MKLVRWMKLAFNRPLRAKAVPAHLLHRWQGGQARCIECGSKDYDDPLHLHPMGRLITIQDVSAGVKGAWQGTLLGLASAIFYVDEGAAVFAAAGWPGIVFAELSDKSRAKQVAHFAAQYRTAGVLLVFVGCEESN